MLRPLAFSLLLVLAAPAAGAQSADADALYHRAARHYIDGENQQAEAAAQAALQERPGDPRTEALLERIRQQQEQQQQQQSGGNQGEEQQDQDGQPGDQSGEGDPQDPDSDQQQEQQDGSPEGQNEQQEAPPQDEGQAEQDATGTDGQPPPEPPTGEGSPPTEGRRGTMTRAEAERILGAVGGDERALLREVLRRRGRPRSVEKDW